jgi:hypothetical protein
MDDDSLQSSQHEIQQQNAAFIYGQQNDNDRIHLAYHISQVIG